MVTTTIGIMAEEKLSFEQTFNFNLLSTKSFNFQEDPKTSRLLMKWSMLGRITAQAFNFDQSFQPYRSNDFAWLLLEADSEYHHIISPSDRQEFLFRLFKHMVLGGELCQYEDVIDPYIETVKIMYKDLVSVQKDTDTKEINVVTTVLKVSAYDHSGLCYPSATENKQTFAYLCIDPCKRHVYVLFHSFGIGDFSGN
ncbi:cilia- and flagella-associated protein 300 isoform X1 [Danio rerio]|uniref:Cilia- and flagella-associated protein 300 isoform X1 n=1 Tax=Danio rerio TaxID=7955 RepID=A0AC58I8P3_DANRE